MRWVKHVLCRGDEECHREKSVGVYGSTVSEEGKYLRKETSWCRSN
jgi:hypothetical protein